MGRRRYCPPRGAQASGAGCQATTWMERKAEKEWTLPFRGSCRCDTARPYVDTTDHLDWVGAAPPEQRRVRHLLQVPGRIPRQTTTLETQPERVLDNAWKILRSQREQ